MIRFAWVWGLVGCGRVEEAAWPVAEAMAADVVPVATVEGVIDALPACEGIEPDGRVDLAEGCVDGGCASMTYADLSAAWGPTSCVPSTETLVRCTWPAGRWARFDDRDHDGLPDPDDTARPLFLEPPYDGATDDGVGVGASLSCFVGSLGYPDGARISDEGAGWRFRSMVWSTRGVEVFDLYGESRASVVALSGAE